MLDIRLGQGNIWNQHTAGEVINEAFRVRYVREVEEGSVGVAHDNRRITIHGIPPTNPLVSSFFINASLTPT